MARKKLYGNNNPWYSAATDKFRSNVNRLIGSVDFTYSPFSWMQATYRLGMDYYSDARTATTPGPQGFPAKFSVEITDWVLLVNTGEVTSRLILT